MEKTFTFTLPAWIDLELIALGTYPMIEDRMALAIRLAKENVLKKTGGPFGAAVFESDSGRLISVGVNLVPTACSSVLHAEIVAVMLAQKTFRNYDLGSSGLPCMDLVTSVEPCAMCLGSVPWSGVRRLICGARHEDAEAVGFDEGAKHDNWTKELESRGIIVVQNVMRQEAAEILNLYIERGGMIYNGRQGNES